MAEAIGAGKVGIRLSPMHHVQGMHEVDEADVRATYGYLVDQLRPLGLAYLSVLHAGAGRRAGAGAAHRSAARSWRTAASHGDHPHEAVALIDSAHADAVAVGRPSSPTPTWSSAGRGSTRRTSRTRRRSTGPVPRATPTTPSSPPADPVGERPIVGPWPGPRRTSPTCRPDGRRDGGERRARAPDGARAGRRGRALVLAAVTRRDGGGPARLRERYPAASLRRCRWTWATCRGGAAAQKVLAGDERWNPGEQRRGDGHAAAQHGRRLREQLRRRLSRALGVHRAPAAALLRRRLPGW